jgi:hypothetical protein
MTPSFFKKKGDFWGNLGGGSRTKIYPKIRPLSHVMLLIPNRKIRKLFL